MIEILTGSNCSQHNKEQFEKINDLLYSKKNPIYKKFNEDKFFLDDCDGFISIVKTNSINKELTTKQLMAFTKYLKQFIKYEGFLYVGGSIVKYNNN